MLAARTAALKRLYEQNGCEGPESRYLPYLVAYCSKEAHSCVEKAAIISLVQLRILEPDADNSLRGEILRKVGWIHSFNPPPSTSSDVYIQNRLSHSIQFEEIFTPIAHVVWSLNSWAQGTVGGSLSVVAYLQQEVISSWHRLTTLYDVVDLTPQPLDISKPTLHWLHSWT